MADIDRTGAGSSILCADYAFAITPSDSSELSAIIRQLYVGVTGDVKVISAGGSTITHVAVPAGAYISGLRIRKVLSTGTTASSLIGYV